VDKYRGGLYAATGSQVFADNCELTGPEGSGTPPPSGNTVIRTRNGSQQTFTNPDLASLLNGAQNGDTYDIQGSYALSNEISIVNKSNIIIRSTGTEAVLDAYGLEVPIVETDSGIIRIGGSTNITIQGLDLRNYVATSSSQVAIGINVFGVNNDIFIDGNNIHHIITTVSASSSCNASEQIGCGNGFGILVKNDTSSTPTTNINITKTVILMALQLQAIMSMTPTI